MVDIARNIKPPNLASKIIYTQKNGPAVNFNEEYFRDKLKVSAMINIKMNQLLVTKSAQNIRAWR